MQANQNVNVPGGEQPYDVAIIGGGPAGLSAALYTARAGLSTVVVDKGGRTGALAATEKIANYPGVADVSGEELARRMREQALSFGAELAQEQVVGVDLESDPKQVFTSSRTVAARAVIVATGALERKSKVPGEEELLGRGVSYCATCDAAFFKGKDVAVVGADDHAAEEALFVARFAREVVFAMPMREPKIGPQMMKELESHERVRLRPLWRLKALTGKAGLESAEFETPEGPQTLHIPGIFLFLHGAAPTVGFLQGALPTGDGGCLAVKRDFSTAIPGVYAVGDVICEHLKQAVVAAAEGVIAALSVEKHLRGRRRVALDYR